MGKVSESMAMVNLDYEQGIANRGNWNRLKQVMKKAQRGEKITVGFLGGSITQGCLSSTPQTCYAYLVYDWWKQKFPDTDVTYVNAGIGGTTSQFGVARADEDLLAHQIDFTTVEFSVNDDDNAHFLETYEGLIRHLYQSERKPALLIVNSVRYDDGGNAQAQHNKIGEMYQIPCVSMQSTIYPKVASGELANRDVTEDDLHPNDLGHQMMANVITYFLEQVYASLDYKEEAFEVLPEPLTVNAYEHSDRYQNHNCSPKGKGFAIDITPQNDIREIFRKGWTAREQGAKLTFEVSGSCIGVQYRKSVTQPTPIARAVVDGDVEHAVILDGNFEETWGDSLHLDTIAEHLENTTHQVEIELIETHEDDKVPFYLVSVIGSY